MKTQLMHGYGMRIRVGDDILLFECRAMSTGSALNDLHRQAQKAHKPAAYVMTEFWEEYPIDQRQTMRQSLFDLPGGPNPDMSTRKRTVTKSHAAEMFSEDELQRCRK